MAVSKKTWISAWSLLVIAGLLNGCGGGSSSEPSRGSAPQSRNQNTTIIKARANFFPFGNPFISDAQAIESGKQIDLSFCGDSFFEVNRDIASSALIDGPRELENRIDDIPKYPVVIPGKDSTFIVSSNQPNEVEVLAAQELQGYVFKMTGRTLPIVSERGINPNIKTQMLYIHIGATEASKAEGLPDELIRDEGIQIKTFEGPDHNYLFLTGRSGFGTLFAVYTFLEKIAGVRWYLPGEIGEHIPKQSEFLIPEISVIENPSFESRQMSGFFEGDDRRWLWKNKMSSPKHILQFSHNMLHIFKPSKYKQTRPDIFPIQSQSFIGPKRYIPIDDTDPRWHPVMTNKFVQDESFRKANEHFSKDPKAKSFSLGMNDGYIYDEASDVPAYNPQKLKNSIGNTHLTDLLFDFASNVGCKVHQQFPDKLIGTLAYQEAHDPPNKPVSVNVVPFLTYDRAMWRDRLLAFKEKNRAAAWLQKAKYLGIYDYYYGASYLVPRFYPHLIDSSIKFYADFGGRVKGYFAEAYPSWGLEGPQLYIASQLLWNSKANVDELLDDFYTNFFKSAKEPMRQYFQKLESLWMNMTPKQERSFKDNARITFHAWYYNGGALQLYTPAAIKELDKYLKTAFGLAATTLVKKRIGLFEKAFRHGKLMALLYNLDQNYFLPIAKVTSKQNATYLLNHLRLFFDLGKQRKILYGEIKQNPILKPRFDYFTQFAPNPQYGYPFKGYKKVIQALKEWAKKNDESQLHTLQQYEVIFPQLLL